MLFILVLYFNTIYLHRINNAKRYKDMARYDLSKIMKRAWALFANARAKYPTFADALRKSWSMAKFEVRVAEARQAIEAEEKARTLYEEQKKLGYEEGARCREEELNREHEKAMESLHAQKKQLEEQYHEKMSVMEKDIVDAVIQVFDKVFKIQFEEKRELLLQLVNGALLDIDPGDKIRIHTNRSDEEILKEHLAQMQDIVGKDVAIEFIKDNKLSDGQCKIETPYGVVDCGVDTQLSALLKDIRSLV